MSFAYSLAVRARNLLFDVGLFKEKKVTVPVISIGNITVGGTGKTPLVIRLTKQITNTHTPAILTRGYKANQGTIDEPSMLARACPQVPIVVNPDRVTGARQAITGGATALILDDGFQHRKLHRDLDIIAIDAMCPFGYKKILPAGLLREPLSCLKRADAVVITRADQIEEKQLTEIENTIRRINPSLVVAAAIHKPVCLRNLDGSESQTEQLKGKKVFTFCGIANPQAFLATIREFDVQTVGSRVYDDHYSYRQWDINQIMQIAENSYAEMVLTTEKDFTKLDPAWLENSTIDFSSVVVKIKLIRGGEQITELIETALAGKISPGD